jgi:F-type H+-transporting ATPase subunit b
MRGRWLVAAVLAVASLPAVASAPDAADAGGGLGQALITPQLGTFFWTLVTFLVFLAILGRYAWRPLLDALRAREQSIADTIDQARREREQAEALLREHQAIVVEARRERAEALAQGQRDAEKVKAEILEEARRQREHLLRQTEEQVGAALRQARSELRGYAADLAIQAAGKLLARNLDDATQRQVVEDHLREIEASAGGSQRPLPS